MIDIYIEKAYEKVEPQDAQKVLEGLIKSEWEPALYASKRKLVDLSPIEDSPEHATKEITNGDPIERFVNGDIFFDGESILYFMTNLGGEEIIEGGPFGVDPEDANPNVEVGIISPSEERNPKKKLKKFQSRVVESISNKLDGRKTRHMEFNWDIHTPEFSRVEDVLSGTEEESGMDFNDAEFSDPESNASEVLSNQKLKNLLVRLNKTKFTTVHDVQSTYKNPENIEDRIEELIDSELVKKEYLLRCKSTQNDLTKLKSPDILDSKDFGELRCPYCESVYEDEQIIRGYSVSELGNKLIQSSHWMEIWVTKRLVSSGIDESNIYWNVSESGEEIDILCDSLGEIWIFELKDREFGPGDAYPLSHRQARYDADKVFVVTTEEVSGNAKDVLEEAISDSERPSDDLVFIEGLSDTTSVLAKNTKASILKYAMHRMSPLHRRSEFDLFEIIASSFREEPINYQDPSVFEPDDDLPF